MAATALTPVAETDPTVAAGNADAVGVVGSKTSMGAVAQGVSDWTGLVPGVAFSVTYVVSGTGTTLSVATAESATGYDISVHLATDGGGIGTSTLNDVIALIAADPTASRIVVVTKHAGSDGSGVLVAVGKQTSSGQVSPDLVTLGTEQTALDTTNGNTFTNTGRERLLIDNADAGTSLVTITSTDTLTVKTFEIDAAKFVNVVLPLAVWGAAPVITGIDTGLKLSVIAGPTEADLAAAALATMTLADIQAAEAALLPGGSPTVSVQDVIALIQTLRDDAGANALEKKAYRRLLHIANNASRRITGTDQRLSGSHVDTL